MIRRTFFGLLAAVLYPARSEAAAVGPVTRTVAADRTVRVAVLVQGRGWVLADTTESMPVIARVAK